MGYARRAQALARAGARLEEMSEPVVPDAIDQGEKPFIRPFMVDMADDHYALDITRARAICSAGNRRRSIRATLPRIIQALKDDPLAWYRDNGITPPPWLESAAEEVDDPEALRAEESCAIAPSIGAISGRTSSISVSAHG